MPVLGIFAASLQVTIPASTGPSVVLLSASSSGITVGKSNQSELVEHVLIVVLVTLLKST